MFLDKFKKYNDGFNILFNIININTRKAYVFPLKNKGEKSIKDAFAKFKEIIKKEGG